MRPITLFWLAFVVAAVLGVYQMKYEVRELKRNVSGLERQIAEEYSSIHVLEAEWAYLSRPERLQALAERHLALAPIAPAQIREEGALALLEDRQEESKLLAEALGTEAGAEAGAEGGGRE